MRKKAATIKDVAELAGVSISSVSRVLNNSDANSDTMRERVLAAVETLSYKPNALARGLKTNSTQTAALVVTDISNPFFSGIAREAEAYLSEHGYTLIICNTGEDPDRELRHLQKLRERQVDGFLLCATGRNNGLIREMHDAGIPIILIDRAYHDLPLDIVKDDNAYGGWLLADLLIQRGHRRIAFLRGAQSSMASLEREQGFRQACAQHGIPLDEALFLSGGVSGDSTRESIGRILEMPVPPTAIFAANILIAKTAISVLAERGLTLPGDMALVCYGMEELKRLYRPSITCILQNPSLVGHLAAQMMVKRLSGGDADPAPCKIVLQPDLFVGDSV
ncbi:MAG TPA: LacI family DNA-binding transcriptional regulator [Clostridia bacterium]|nr:LacI family DNA-binding transcriptional regulator [Clostridia bacterium]